MHDTDRVKHGIRRIKRRLAEHPRDRRLHFELGKAYYVLGRFDQAAEEFREAVRSAKLKAEARFGLARSLQKQGLWEQAERHYLLAEEDGLSLDRTLDILYNRMTCASEAGDKAKAIRLGKRIMKLDQGYREL